MKKNILAIGAAVIASLALAVNNAQATWGPPTFNLNVTNYIYGGSGSSNQTAWPSLGTNSAYPATGQAANIAAADHIGINLQGLMVYPTQSAGTNGSVTLLVVYSYNSGVPNTLTASNAYSNSQVVTNQNDWCNTNFATTIVFTPPAGVYTNWVNYMTNLDVPGQFADAANVGIYSIQNDLGATGFITNMTITVTAKQPVRPVSN